MTKKLLLLLLMALSFQAFATYDFSAVAPSGQTLCYKILSTTDYTVGVIFNPNSMPSGNLTIPSVVNHSGHNYTVTRLCYDGDTIRGTFDGDTLLTSVVIPSTVTVIDGRAFQDCKNLVSAQLPDTLTSIGYWAFRRCRSLHSIDIPSGVTEIPSQCFCGCNNLTSVSLPNTVTSLGIWAFDSCMSLSSINIPDSVTEIQLCCFRKNEMLRTVTLPASVTTLNVEAFAECTRLTEVYYNCTNLSIMGHSNGDPTVRTVFRGCDSITTVHIGSSVTSLPRYCFYGCSSIRDVYSHATTAPTWSWTSILYGVDSATVHIPCGSGVLSSYQSEWSSVSSFVQQPLYDISFEANDTAAGTVQLITAPTCAAPQVTLTASANEGYRFNHWSNGEITNTLTFTVTQDTHFVAYFTHLYNVVANSNDSTRGYATGEGVYDEGTEVVVEAFPYEGYRFVSWSNGDTANPTTVVLTSDTVMMASFEPIQYTVTAETNDPSMGSVTGAGTYNYGDTVTLEAVPNEGYQFVSWSNGDTVNPFVFIPTSDTTFTATFEPLPVGIDEVDGQSYTIATQGLSVIIRGAAGEQLTIYDVTGRVLVSERCVEGQRYTMPSVGVYMIKVGCSTPKKVIVK